MGHVILSVIFIVALTAIMKNDCGRLLLLIFIIWLIFK